MLDLNNNFDLVSKIVRSKFSGYAVDTDDLIQDVCYKIHRQNLGNNAYDPARGSESRYVYMIADSIVKKTWRRKKNDPMRHATSLEDEYQSRAIGDSHFGTVLCKTLEDRLKEESEALADIFDMTLQGFSRREIATMSGYTEYQIRKGRAKVRELLTGDVQEYN